MTKSPTSVHFLDSIHHKEPLNIFTGVRGHLPVAAILFDSETCKHNVMEEPDGSRIMHDVNFSDGSNCYFETDADGVVVHFMSSAFLELRDGLLVVSPRSAYQAKRSDRLKAIGPGDSE
jgi:hypothetical protein